MKILKIRTPKRSKSSKPKCRLVGCGKPAVWPRDGRPVFCTRLCGYIMAVCLVRGQRPARHI